MRYEDVLSYFGSQAQIARALKIEPPSVSAWQSTGVPGLRQIQIEKLTRGKLKAAPTIFETKKGKKAA